MEKELGFEDYISVAKLIASCPKERMPVVIDMIKKSGINMDEVECERMILSTARKNSLSQFREKSDKNRWKDTNNHFALYLRQAFDDGISFTEVSNISGINRTTIYKCLWGDRVGSSRTQQLVREAIETMRAKYDI